MAGRTFFCSWQKEELEQRPQNGSMLECLRNNNGARTSIVLMSEPGEGVGNEDMAEVVARSYRAFWPLSGICFCSEWNKEALEDLGEKSDMI